MAKSINDVLNLIKENDIKMVDFKMVDIHGQYRHVTIPAKNFSEETMKKFALGYSNITSDDLVNYLKSKGFKDELIVEAGLGSVDEKIGLHDKFWNRVMFPIMDVHSHVIGFGGRVMGDGEPKYLNSPETKIFDKSRNLYGLNLARTARKNNIILCKLLENG